MSRFNALVASVSFALLASCSESTTDDASGGAGADTTSATGASGGASNGGDGGAGATTGGSANGGAASTPLIINELSALGDDYIEIFNPTSQEVDAGGLKIADSDGPGVPKVADAISLPSGTKVAPGAYLFILADVADAMPGPQTTCDPGPSPCFHAPWGLSKDGDEAFILGSNDAILDQAVHPATGVLDGQTWGRLPNATGDFGLNQPTPGAANEAP